MQTFAKWTLSYTIPLIKKLKIFNSANFWFIFSHSVNPRFLSNYGTVQDTNFLIFAYFRFEIF